MLAPFLETTLAGASGLGQPPHLTPIGEVVMYGIDADTNELLRYTFDTNEYVRIGVVQDEDGRELDDVEGLAYIPQGPHKGFYGSPTKGTAQERLFRINPLDATARACPQRIGFSDILGMIAVQDPATGDWLLVAVEKGENLIAIDPATGKGEVIMPLGRRFEGIARSTEGVLYVVDRVDLWTIDPASGQMERMGPHGYGKVEALEYAVGDYQPRIKIPQVPDAWTQDGILFGFSDDADALLVMNPRTGSVVEFDCSFATIDCEGLVFTTKLTDPYGIIVANPCD